MCVDGVFHDTMDIRLEYVDFYNRIHLCGYNFGITIDELSCGNVRIKPYLRPMTAMTENEAVEYFRLQMDNPYAKVEGFSVSSDTLCLAAYVDDNFWCRCWDEISNVKTFDWLNERMFDYRGLIGKGLALVAPDGMYDFSDGQSTM